MAELQAPAFYMPYVAGVNPHVEQARAHAVGWASEWGLASSPKDRRRFDRADYPFLFASFLPEAPAEKLELALDWAVWEFSLDDYFSDTYQSMRDIRSARKVVAGIRALLSGQDPGPAAVGGPIEMALADLRHRTMDVMTEAWRKRFFDGIIQFSEAYIWETMNLARGSAPDLIDHIQTRRYGSGTQSVFNLLEYAMNFEIPQRLVNARPVRVIAESVVDNIMHVNDIFSYAKERAHGDVHNNVHILIDSYGYSLADAIDTVNQMAKSQMLLHQRAVTEELPELLAESPEDDEIQRGVMQWATLTRYWPPGNLTWHRKTNRYNDIDLWYPDRDIGKWAQPK